MDFHQKVDTIDSQKGGLLTIPNSEADTQLDKQTFPLSVDIAVRIHGLETLFYIPLKRGDALFSREGTSLHNAISIG